MTTAPTPVSRDTPANVVLDLILADRVRYPCLCSFAYQLAESLETIEPELAADCLAQVNDIVCTRSDPDSVRRFANRHGRGWSDEARAFHAAMMFLIDEDEGRRAQYLGLGIAARRHFVKCRLWGAREMHIEHGIAL